MKKAGIEQSSYINCVEDRSTSAQGYIRRYTRNETTGRPNQVLICLICNAEKPKLTKMMRHLNVHRRDGTLRTDHEAAPAGTVEIESTIRLPAFKNVANNMPVKAANRELTAPDLPIVMPNMKKSTVTLG